MMSIPKSLALLISLAALLTVGNAPSFAQNSTIRNPQLYFVGSRFQSLGVSNPVIPGDVNGVFINPAVLGSIEQFQLMLSSQQTLDAFDYMMFGIAFPLKLSLWGDGILQRFTAAIAIGSVGTNGIPHTLEEVVSVDKRHFYQAWQYGSGFRIIQGSMGTVLYDAWGFNTFSIGGSAKYFQQNLAQHNRSTFSFDLGTQASYHIENSFVQRVNAGISILNFLPGTLTWQKQNDLTTDITASLPFNFLFGVGVDIFNDTASIYLHNTLEGFSLSTEIMLPGDFLLRASTDFGSFSIGTGIQFDTVSMGYQNYGLRLDYNQKQNLYPFESNPDRNLAFSIIGETRLFSPQILSPKNGFLTKNTTVDIHGVGPKQTAIRIYDNGRVAKTVWSNRYGKWEAKSFVLLEGKNRLFIQAHSLEKGVSLESDPIEVLSDNHPPSIEVTVLPVDNTLKIRVVSNEDLASIEALLDNRSLELTQVTTSVWEAVQPLPPTITNMAKVSNHSPQIVVSGRDKVGNNKTQKFTVFTTIQFPHDKYVHYREEIRILGESSPMLKSVKINDNEVVTDNQFRFATTIGLKLGKNLVKVRSTTLNDRTLTNTIRILRLKTYPDIEKTRERREIEFMATLRVIDGDKDGNFKPDTPVNRAYIARLLVNAAAIPLPVVTGDIYSDVPASHPDAASIKAAVENGLMFANPDGTFKPEQPLTVQQTMTLLGAAGLVGEEEIKDGDKVLTRKALAELLAYNPKYEPKVEDLMNWERGYK